MAAASMKKTYLYTFFPTKKEELEAAIHGITFSNLTQVPRILVEIRDDTLIPTMLLPKIGASNSNNDDNHNNNNSNNNNNNSNINNTTIETKYDPWKIRKFLSVHEILTGRILLSHDDVFEYVFRYSSLELANRIVSGNKVLISVCDYTDETAPVLYGPNDEHTYIEKGLHDEYTFGVNMDLINNRGFKKDDEIGIYYDPRSQIFYLKSYR